MSFERTFGWVSYALVLTGFGSVALSGDLGAVLPLLFVGVVVASMFRDPTSAEARPAQARFWTGVLIAALAVLVGLSFLDGNWLVHALHFAMAMTISRVFQRRYAKDSFQLFALTFLLVLTGAVINPGPSFAVCFLAYTVLIIWGLTMLHLVREIEVQTHTGPEHLEPQPKGPKRRWLGLLPPKKNGKADIAATVPDAPVSPETLAWRARRLVGPGFLVASSTLSLVVFAVSISFFFFFPRLGLGFFFANTRKGQQVIGFSDKIDLGHFGNLKGSTEVVMRVEFPKDPDRAKEPVRLRGMSFDTWDGMAWSKDPGKLVEMASDMDGYRVLSTPRPRPEDALVDLDIYLEPLDTVSRPIFTPPRALYVQPLETRFDHLRKLDKRFYRDAAGDLTFSSHRDTSLRYATTAIVERDDDAQVRTAQGPMPERLLQTYTALPPDVDPRLTALARRLATQDDGRGPEQVSVLEQASAIELRLRNDWGYSLEGDLDPNAPLDDFLFGRKHGHCEYFATSMVLMLRTLGVPSRPVNGFVGGTYNPYGNYLIVRSGEAHSWVEVFFPGYGWRTFDPTPPLGQIAPQQTGLFATLGRLVDTATLQWYKWVIEYDLEKQIRLFKGLGSGLRDLGNSLAGKAGSDEAREREGGDVKLKLGPEHFAILAIAAVLLAVLRPVARRWWRRRTHGVAEAARTEVEEEVLALGRKLGHTLAKRGHPRAAHETWRDVVVRLRERGAKGDAELTRFAEVWDAARFGRDGPDGEAVERLRGLAGDVRRVVRRVKTARR